ncbi:MAG: 50S ribosomal protein L3 N(5)-glutamine methyltransferase [Acidiferrobacterales bacterium]|nr:50S ribosomal protein L3 N(5)-glutamine methyltransferase [Acidiferrobacterales bacterium]
MIDSISDSDITLEEMVEVVDKDLTNASLSFGQGTEDASEEAYWLVLSACDEPLGQEQYDWGKKLSASQVTSVKRLLSKRIETRQPLGYLLNEAWFAGIDFYIDERALIPRSFMAEWLPEQFSPWVSPQRTHRILDLCCGSGCIGISAALYFPGAEVVLSDISQDALEVAQINIKRHALADRVSVNHGAMFEGVSGKFDLILCNPPYVSHERMRKLPEEFQTEPRLALEAGEDGLDFLKPFLHEVGAFLNPEGAIVVESGSASPVLEEVYQVVPFNWLSTEHDEMVLFHLDAMTLSSVTNELISIYHSNL